jgi:hypothetical protein
MIVFSGDLDRIPAAFVIDTGAAAMGMAMMKSLMKKRTQPPLQGSLASGHCRSYSFRVGGDSGSLYSCSRDGEENLLQKREVLILVIP